MKSHGCKDFDLKMKAIFALAGLDDTDSFEKKIESLYERNTPDRETLKLIFSMNDAKVRNEKVANITANIVTSARTYNRHKPTGTTGRVFLAVVQTVFEKCDVAGSAKHLIQDATYAHFYGAVPDSKRGVIPAPIDGEARADVSSGQALTHKALPTVKEGIAKGRIDQLLHYASPDGPAAWDAIRTHPSYKQSDECLETLNDLLSSEWWRAFVAKQQTLNLYILGGGAAEKDAAIIRKTLGVKDRTLVVYRLFDASQYMIVHTIRAVREQLRGLMDRVEICHMQADFTTLADIEPQFLGFRKGHEKLAWFCPGGTIGNLNEEAVFKSVSRQSQAGDLFVVGAEHLDEALDNRAMEQKYQGPGIERFVTAPLASASALDRGIAMKIADKKFRLNPPELLSAELSKAYTSVPGARTLEISMPIEHSKLVLHTSTRYPNDGLPLLAKKHGFALKETFSSKRNPHYKTFLFENCGQ